jgi:hypothetical protein
MENGTIPPAYYLRRERLAEREYSPNNIYSNAALGTQKDARRKGFRAGAVGETLVIHCDTLKFMTGVRSRRANVSVVDCLWTNQIVRETCVF